jgi:hypothetical protein
MFQIVQHIPSDRYRKRGKILTLRLMFNSVGRLWESNFRWTEATVRKKDLKAHGKGQQAIAAVRI